MSHTLTDVCIRVFYWFGEYYSRALLAQAVVMIIVQSALLKVALDNRPATGAKNGIEHTPFSSGHNGFTRPYDFWQWKSTKPYVLSICDRKTWIYLAENTDPLCFRYWMFLTYFVAVLFVLHITPIADSASYINLLGCIGLAVEATLPIPQIIANHRSGSCKGFRVSVLASWLIGDSMKMSFFFCSTETIPWAFKLCGMFQCVCDCYLGLQYWMFTRNSVRAAGSSQEQEERWGAGEKDIRMT